MKTLKTVVLTVLFLVAASAMGWAQSYNANKASIIGSPHDLTNDTWSATSGGTSSAVTTNTCFFCHIVHKTNTSRGIATTENLAPGYMLWNHQLSSTATYGVYSSDTFQSVLTAAGASAPTDLGLNNNLTTPTVSNLCLSCHDGTVAIGSFYESGFGLPANGSYWNNGHGNSSTMYTGMQIDDLTKSHPVNFIYNSAVANAANLKVPAGVDSVDGHGAVPLFGNSGYMQCATCHDPHNGTTLASGTAVPFARLALQNAETAQTGGYCTYCHN